MVSPKFGWELYKREAEINKLVSVSTKTPKTIFFNGESMDLKVISVPIELLAYRLENGRTSSAQDQYVASIPDTPEDFFTRDLSSPEAQEAQHALLMKLVKSTRLEKEFKKTENQQTEPLICTLDGFVINGNRRLSYWRYLYYEFAESYPFYKYVDIALFPFSDEDSILQLEVDLQIAPDIQDDYIWHAEAKMIIRYRDKYGFDSEQLAKKFKKDSKKDIDELIGMYNVADEYLSKNGIPKQWDIVTNQLQAFKDISNYLFGKKSFTSDAHATVFKNTAFSFIKLAINKELEGSSAHKFIENVWKFYPNVEAALLTNYAEEVENIAKFQGTNPDVEVLLQNGFDVNNEQQRLAALSKILESGNQDKEIADIAIETIEEQQSLQREKKHITSVFSNVKDAHGKLESAVITISNKSNVKSLSKSGVAAQLEGIESCLRLLKEWLE